MPLVRSLLATCLSLLAAAAILWAPAEAFASPQENQESGSLQALERPAEVYFRVGYGSLYDDEGGLGSGPGVAGGFVWQLSERLGAGVDVERMEYSRTRTISASFEGEGFIGTGNLYLYLLNDRPHQIYLAGGAGAVSYEHRVVDVLFDDEGNPTEVTFEDSETAFGVRGAAGARLNARPDLVVRLEASLFWGETQIVEAPFAWLQASISLGYRF